MNWHGWVPAMRHFTRTRRLHAVSLEVAVSKQGPAYFDFHECHFRCVKHLTPVALIFPQQSCSQNAHFLLTASADVTPSCQLRIVLLCFVLIVLQLTYSNQNIDSPALCRALKEMIKWSSASHFVPHKNSQNRWFVGPFAYFEGDKNSCLGGSALFDTTKC